MEGFDQNFSKKIGILITNLGTPDNPNKKSLKKYLKQFLSDRRVVDYNPIFWKFEWSRTDFTKKSVDYSEIMSGGPPKDGIYDLFPRGAGYGGGNNDDLTKTVDPSTSQISTSGRPDEETEEIKGALDID